MTPGDRDAYEKSPAAAGRTAGYAPLVSDLAPDGYALKAVGDRAGRTRPVSWLSDKVSNPPVGLRGTAVL